MSGPAAGELGQLHIRPAGERDGRAWLGQIVKKKKKGFFPFNEL